VGFWGQGSAVQFARISQPLEGTCYSNQITILNVGAVNFIKFLSIFIQAHGVTSQNTGVSYQRSSKDKKHCTEHLTYHTNIVASTKERCINGLWNKRFVLVQFVLKKVRSEKRYVSFLIIISGVFEAFAKKRSARRASRYHKTLILPQRPISLMQAASKQHVVCTVSTIIVKSLSFMKVWWVFNWCEIGLLWFKRPY
jgi:hypothetical protein